MSSFMFLMAKRRCLPTTARQRSGPAWWQVFPPTEPHITWRITATGIASFSRSAIAATAIWSATRPTTCKPSWEATAAGGSRTRTARLIRQRKTFAATELIPQSVAGHFQDQIRQPVGGIEPAEKFRRRRHGGEPFGRTGKRGDLG